MQHQQEIQKQMSFKVCEYERIASTKHLGSQSLGNKGGNSEVTQSLAILSFVERLLLMRYKYPDLLHQFIYQKREPLTHQDVIGIWMHSRVGLTASSSSSSASKELHQDVDDGMYYIPAISFMMAYKTLRRYLASTSFIEDTDASTSCDARKTISLQNMAKDAVVVTALQVIFISKSLASALIRLDKDGTVQDPDDGNNNNDDDGEYVLKIFRREMDMVDSLVRSIQDARTKSKKPSESQHSDTKFADSKSEGASPDNEMGNSRFQELWEAAKADANCSEGDSDNDNEDPHRQDEMHRQVRNTSMKRMNPNHKDARRIHEHDTSRYTKDLNDLSKREDKVTADDAVPIRHADSKDPDDSSEVGGYEDNSLNLWSVLLNFWRTM